MTGACRLEETKRIGRVIQIIQMIASNPGRYLRRTLAEHFEVSERMIQKDLDIIRNSCKFDLLHSPAGYSFECVPRFPLKFSLSEALSLLMAVDAAWQISGVGSSELAASIDKLKSIFPAEFISLLNKVTDQPLPAESGEHRRKILSLLNHALARKHKVRMLYETRSRDGQASERTICPYHIKLHVRSWHVIAYCQNREAIRTFKIDRIRQASLTGERYTIPADFDVLDYLGETWGVMSGTGRPPVDIVLHFEPEAGHWVCEEQWHASQSFEELPDGSILFRVRIDITPEFVNWLLYYGSRVQVLEPDYLRKQVAAEHMRAATQGDS
ncbi:MAG: helix-turn-helix transcriptional regulator [Syntrophobacteraceae bacterium]